MYRRATGETLDPTRRAMAEETLRALQRRYHAAPDDAAKLLAVGDSPRAEDLDAADHAAFTLLASAFLDLDATIFLD
jgi:hypothetical protein